MYKSSEVDNSRSKNLNKMKENIPYKFESNEQKHRQVSNNVQHTDSLNSFLKFVQISIFVQPFHSQAYLDTDYKLSCSEIICIFSN